MLNCTAISTIPRNKTIRDNLFEREILLTLSNRYPINKFRQAQSTFTVADESPLPGGFENGVGNISPETP